MRRYFAHSAFLILASAVAGFTFIIVFHVFAPWPVKEIDIEAISVTTAVAILHDMHEEKNELFLRINGRNPEDAVLKKIRYAEPASRIKPYQQKQKSSDTERCIEPQSQLIPLGLCDDRLLDVRFISMPLWHLAVANGTTGGCYHELILVLFWSQWRVVSHRWMCI